MYRLSVKGDKAWWIAKEHWNKNKLLKAVLKELTRFIAEGDVATGYMGKED